MTRFRNYVAAGAGIVFLSIVLAVTGASTALASHVEGAAHRFVNNPSTQPANVHVGGTPFTARVGSTWSEGFTGSPTASISIPSGKRLIIEFVSMRAFVSPGQRVHASINTASTPSNGTYHLQFAPQGNFTRDLLVATEAMRVPANATTVTISASRSSGTGTGSWLATVAGYLVPA